jgi:pimeloyl-ACP methyl ester carboxylesterase
VTTGITIENIDGEHVHVVESGPADGPPLLLSAGLGDAWFDWAPTVELLERRHRVINFDRPGLGLSPAAKAAPSLRRDAALLAGLAERAAGRAGAPVTVVAHSMAGFHAEALARLRPELVRGLVLVDPSYERDPHARLRLSPVLIPAANALGVALGVTRLARFIGPAGRKMIMHRMSDRDEPVPPEVIRSVYGRGTVLGTALAEEFAYREMAVDLAALRERRPFPKIPLVVLTALGEVKDPGKRAEWVEDHRRLAEMTPYGSQVELPDCKHMVTLDRPDAVADAVARVMSVETP